MKSLLRLSVRYVFSLIVTTRCICNYCVLSVTVSYLCVVLRFSYVNVWSHTLTCGVMR